MTERSWALLSNTHTQLSGLVPPALAAHSQFIINFHRGSLSSSSRHSLRQVKLPEANS